jgi:hypothetical protein
VRGPDRCAVVGAIAEYAHDTGRAILDLLGVGLVVPHESTIRRVLQDLDPAAVEAAIRSWGLAQLAARPAPEGVPVREQRQVQTAHRATATAHGRREIRRLKVVTIVAGIEFPHAAQAIQITRKTRPIRAGKAGKWSAETVYAITDWHHTRPDPTSSPPGSAGTGRSRTPCTGCGM